MCWERLWRWQAALNWPHESLHGATRLCQQESEGSISTSRLSAGVRLWWIFQSVKWKFEALCKPIGSSPSFCSCNFDFLTNTSQQELCTDIPSLTTITLIEELDSMTKLFLKTSYFWGSQVHISAHETHVKPLQNWGSLKKKLPLLDEKVWVIHIATEVTFYVQCNFFGGVGVCVCVCMWLNS